MKKNIKRKFRNSNPSMHVCEGRPKTVFDAVNKFGTFNIQDTCEMQNEFPKISQSDCKISKSGEK